MLWRQTNALMDENGTINDLGKLYMGTENKSDQAQDNRASRLAWMLSVFCITVALHVGTFTM
jgi:hypothetical protein